ncbi:MAG: LamG-like jellyroll fold domain-containing protein [bacterium]
MMRRLIHSVAVALATCCAIADGVVIKRFEPLSNTCRAGRTESVIVIVENVSEREIVVDVQLANPVAIRLISALRQQVALAPREKKDVIWTLQTESEGVMDLNAMVSLEGVLQTTAQIKVCFMPPVTQRKLSYIPEPKPAKSEILVGAHHCPLWEADKYQMWDNVLKHPERTPALGFYAQENPQVSDWETTWAVEHGVSFFIYCWYRTSQGGAVKTRFGSAIHDALFKSRYRDKMKFTIMWENQNRGSAGVADEADLFENLLPYWIENYFKHPSYLKIDNKPVLFVYRPEYLVQDLGSKQAVARAFDQMRQACKKVGFAGLFILGEYRGIKPEHLGLLKDLGLDYTFAYCWGIPNSPTPEKAVQIQMSYIRKTQELNILPQVVTVSQAWSGWRDEGSIWKIPPYNFEMLLREAKAFISTLPAEQLGSKMLLLDNWNEWGEGHYIAPYREYGFGYLDAVRKVFAPDAGTHEDLVPEDIGMGPYDKGIRQQWMEDNRLHNMMIKHVVKPVPIDAGLVGMWSFDESESERVSYDYSGNRNGGAFKAARQPGIDGLAMACNGGSVKIAYHPSFSMTSGVTVACWVKTEIAHQSQGWFFNHVFGGCEATGYRFGLMDGQLCFNVPQTAWSHTARSKANVPLGQWVHVAGTCDGSVVRVYMDGVLAGTLERTGAIKTNNYPLMLGSYEENHTAHFKGLLDEVRLYKRALNAEEISRLAAEFKR